MTREEIVKMGYKKFPKDIIEIVNDDNSITRKDCNCNLRNAYMQGLIDNNISFHTDIDEAAKEHVRNVYNDISKVSAERVAACKFDFKAGVEWLTEQGMNYEDVVQYYPDGDVLYLDKTAEEHIALEDKFKDGDKVIVQIRKV